MKLIHNKGVASERPTSITHNAVDGNIRQVETEHDASTSLVVPDLCVVMSAPSQTGGKAKVTLTRARGGGWIGPRDPRSNRELFDLAD